MKIADLLADRTKYPDDVKVNLFGEEISMGDFRRQNYESQGDLAHQLDARKMELDTQDAKQKRATTALAQVLENVSRATGLSYEQLVKGEIPANLRPQVAEVTRSTVTESGVPLDQDPLFKPIFDTAINPILADLRQTKTAMGTAIQTYINDRPRIAYLEFMALDQNKPKDFKMSFTDALQLAVNKGYRDDAGTPDVARAMRESSAPMGAKAIEEQRYQDGISEGRRQAQLDQLAQLGQPQPGVGGIQADVQPPSAGGKAEKVPTIAEQLNKAFADPAIAGTLFGQTVQ